MDAVFSVRDRQVAFDYILSTARQCGKIVSLVQVGSGAKGYHDDQSDLDFVIALDSDDSMTEIMEYMHRRISDKYELLFSKQDKSRHDKLAEARYKNYKKIILQYKRIRRNENKSI